jgi:hypothetical protein
MSYRVSVRSLGYLLPVATFFVGIGYSQTPDPASWQSKLTYHALNAYGPTALAESAIYAGYLQEVNHPREWGQGAEGYGKRLGSTLAYSGIRNALAFGMDTTLHQDPRYYRSGEGGVWGRTKHVVRGTFLTRKDSGGETLATWRFGSAYGAAFLSNEWYPDRLNTVKLGLEQGSTQIAFDMLVNCVSEFWPDLKSKILRRKP